MVVKAILPTRGLIYAKTIKGLLANIPGEDIIIVDGKPMPDCWNLGIKQALDERADYIWMVEEDNELPKGILQEMLSFQMMRYKIVTMDYPVARGSHINYIDEKVAWCGIGCTLIAREVFEKIPYPWFEVDKHLEFRDDGFQINKIPENVVGKKWGGHDALFFYGKTRPLGYTIKVVPNIVGDHYRCEEIVKREFNHGQYNIFGLKGKNAR